MNNYQPQGQTTSRLINDGYIYQSPTSVAVSLLLQQKQFANRCVQFIGATGPFIRNGQDVTNEIQTHLTTLSQSVPMTAASAQAYFSNVSTVFWSSCVVDWLAGYIAITSYVFS